MSENVSSQKINVKKITTLAMFAAVAYIMVLISHFIPIKVAGFLSYDPKDIIIVIAAFIFGPMAGTCITILVSIIEMITISQTGPIGLLMNIISTCAFVCIASLIYKYKHSISGAIIGLICGVISMTCIMLLWNILITPLYMGIDRSIVISMLPTVFLPFNLIKGGLNAAITLIIYKPLVKGLRQAKLIPNSNGMNLKKNITIGTIIIGVFIAITLLLFLRIISQA